MATTRDAPHSFIVKVWLEQTAGKASTPVIRGHITHVPSRQRRYIQDLMELLDFIRTYLTQD